VRVYLFNTDGTYLGRYQVTDIDGWSTFILPEGTYRFRVDADGIQRWSADITITADQSQVVEVDLN
jgi:major membrane immunogen (membrane-anchored lipoprotein)